MATTTRIQRVFVARTLSELASIQMARSLLTESVIKNFIDVKAQANITPAGALHLCSLYDDLMEPKNVLFRQLLKSFHLPIAIEDDIMHIIECMISLMLDWIVWINQYIDSYTKPIHYINHATWTDSGRIDEVNIIRSMYTAKIFPENLHTFAILCEFSIEDLILDLWPTVEQSIYGETDNIFVNYWSCYLGKCYQVQECNHEEYDVMFAEALEKANYTACKYFWKLCNNDEKEEAILFVLDWPMWSIENIKVECINKPIDAIMFFWQQLSGRSVEHLFKSMLMTFWISECIKRWPWDSVIINTLRQSWDLLDPTSRYDYLCALSTSLYGKLMFIRNFRKWWDIFSELWRRLNASEKRSFDITVILFFLRDRHLALKFIIDDPDLKDKKLELLKVTVGLMRNHITEDKEFWSKVENLLKVFDLVGEERRWLKMKFESLA